MGTTIDEAMTNLESLQKDYQDFHDEVWKDPETYSINAESLKIAIDTMRKYQKIEQIVNEYNLQLCNNTSDGAYNFQRIKEVIEDGKND